MGRDDQNVGAIGPVHNPQHTTTELDNGFVRSRPLRMSWVWLDPVGIGIVDRRVEPGRIDLPHIDRFSIMLA